MNEQPHPSRVRLLPWQVPDRLIDAALIGLLTVGFLVRNSVDNGAYEAGEWIAFAIAVGLVLVRRAHPVPTLAAALAASAVVIAVTDRPTVLFPVALVALFTVAQQNTRRIAAVAGAITTLSFLLMITALLKGDAIEGAGLAAIAWPAFAAAAGAAVRAVRESVATAQERALQAEQSRELEAQRRVIEERLRIARDVHDLVAHHIAVINVQSAVAGHLMESDADAAGEALDAVRDAASTVVDQLGELLGVLRSPEDATEPTTPTPDLTAVEDLIASFAASGLDIRHETSGTPRAMSGLAEVTAYRVVQESLTNAHKHGVGAATVSLRFDDQGLEVAVTNPTPGPVGEDEGSGGFGLVGMRERVEAIGGSISAGPSPDGQRFEVHAKLPGTDQE